MSTVYNEEALKSFGATGKGSTYRLCKSIYGWQIRERTTGGSEDTCFTGTFDECKAKTQEYINAGYGVIINE